MSRCKNIVFDVGSVLVNWMRINLYTTLFSGNKEKAKLMIDHVVTNEWNDQTDLGKPIDECLFDLKQAGILNRLEYQIDYNMNMYLK